MDRKLVGKLFLKICNGKNEKVLLEAMIDLEQLCM